MPPDFEDIDTNSYSHSHVSVTYRKREESGGKTSVEERESILTGTNLGLTLESANSDQPNIMYSSSVVPTG